MERYRIILDSGALSAFAKEGPSFRTALLQAASGGTADIVIPTVVVAESTTGDGSRDANVNRILNVVPMVPLDESIARAAAALRHATRTRRSGTVDAIVVATADQVAGTRVLTSDAHDLVPLAGIMRRTTIISINP